MKYMLILKHKRCPKLVEPKLLVYSREFLGISSIIHFISSFHQIFKQMELELYSGFAFSCILSGGFASE